MTELRPIFIYEKVERFRSPSVSAVSAASAAGWAGVFNCCDPQPSARVGGGSPI